MLHWCLEAPPETERVWGALCTFEQCYNAEKRRRLPRKLLLHRTARCEDMHLIGENYELYKMMEEQMKTSYEQLYTRLQGFSFFITEEQLQTLPLKVRSGSAERLLDIMRQLRSPLYLMIASIVSEDYLFFTTSQ